MKIRDLIDQTQKSRKTRNFLYNFRLPVLFGIILYQNYLSPDHSWLKGMWPFGFCRFKPTCSEYGYEAILRFGIIKGGWLATKRIIRCNPITKPGYDPVPGHNHDNNKDK